MVNVHEVKGKCNRRSKNAGKRVIGSEVLCFMTSVFMRDTRQRVLEARRWIGWRADADERDLVKEGLLEVMFIASLVKSPDNPA